MILDEIYIRKYKFKQEKQVVYNFLTFTLLNGCKLFSTDSRINSKQKKGHFFKFVLKVDYKGNIEIITICDLATSQKYFKILYSYFGATKPSLENIFRKLFLTQVSKT